MKTVLHIGYQKFLFPDESKASRALALLAGAIQVDNNYDAKGEFYQVMDAGEERKLSLNCLPSGTRIQGMKAKTKSGSKKEPLMLQPPNLLTWDDSNEFTDS